MKKVFVAIVLTLGFATLANAQATRTWVSGVGDDVNPCSRTAPCKTFAGAISKTASPGIINCLDPGGFGAVTITKSIEIDCTGTLGSILSSGVQGIIINGQTTDNIVLRALAINGSGTTLGTNGIVVLQANSVSVYYCNVAKYSGDALRVANTSGSPQVFVSNSDFLNSGVGVHLLNSAGVAKLQMESSTVQGNTTGVQIAGTNNSPIIARSYIGRSTNTNFQVDNAGAVCFLESTTIGPGTTGISTVAGANVRLSRVTIAGNTSNGISGTGTTTCFSNNVIAGNLGNQACSVPLQAQQ